MGSSRSRAPGPACFCHASWRFIWIGAGDRQLDTWTAWASGRDAAERIPGACKEEFLWGTGEERGLQHGKAAAGRVRRCAGVFSTSGRIGCVFVGMPKHLPKMMLTHATSLVFGTHATPLPRACTRGAFDAVSHPTLLLGRLTRNLLQARLCPSQASRLEPAQGLDRPAHCSKGPGPVIVPVLRLLRTDFSLRHLIAGMLLDRRLSIGP